MIPIKKLKILGDSILKGVVYSPEGKHYSLCRENRAETLTDSELTVENYSKMGATVLDGVRTLELAADGADENTTVIIEFGGNDCDHDWQDVSDHPDRDHFPKVDSKQFSEYLKRCIEKVKKIGARAVVAISPPIVAEKYFSFISKGRSKENLLKWLNCKDSLYRWQEYYTIIAAKTALSEGVETIDLRTPFLLRQDYGKYFCDDGIHPNPAGHKLITEQIRAFFKKK